MTGALHTDVLVVGHGLVGSVAARLLADAGADVLLVDAGAPLSDPAGSHLRNSPVCGLDGGYFHDLQASHLRRPSRRAGAYWETTHNNPLPGVRTTLLMGGMGALWSCFAPRLHPDLESGDLLTEREWEGYFQTAESLLSVRTVPSDGPVAHVLEKLADRGCRPARLAARSTRGGPRWTGPAEVLDGARVRVLPNVRVLGFRHASGRVRGVSAVAAGTRESVRVDAFCYLLAAGPLGNVEVLANSALPVEGKSGHALGRYLVDHPLSFAQVKIPGAPDPRPDRWPIAAVTPTREGRPWFGLVSEVGEDDDSASVGRGRRIGLYWYSKLEPRRDNRVLLRPARAAAATVSGFAYTLTPDDLEVIRATRLDLESAAADLGHLVPSHPTRTLSAGSSMHLYGTTRMGAAADGSSVTDTYGRVWGLDNLYVIGTSVIPHATASNPALAACALAVRSAHSILGYGA